MMKDPIKTIERVAEAGYKYLEAANHMPWRILA